MSDAARNAIAYELLMRIRDWLKDGATIRARDPQGRVLDFETEPGKIYGGLEIRYPESDHTPS